MRAKDRSNFDRFFEHDVDLENRTILIHDLYYSNADEAGVSSLMFQRFFKAYHALTKLGSSNIHVTLNSKGGDWHSAIAIYDLITQGKCHVTIEAMGICASSATVILQAGHLRISHPNTIFMIHDGEEGFIGAPKSFEAWAKNSKHTRDIMYNIYASRSNRSHRFWEKRSVTDFIMSPSEALKLGFIDSIKGNVRE